VETKAQCQQLALLGCDEIQGYVLSRPVKAPVFEARFLRPQPTGRAAAND
jgi:EAL domain-containing protein (putative c-di-GMP-specific phosphodiesterase class I)